MVDYAKVYVFIVKDNCDTEHRIRAQSCERFNGDYSFFLETELVAWFANCKWMKREDACVKEERYD